MNSFYAAAAMIATAPYVPIPIVNQLLGPDGSALLAPDGEDIILQ